MSSIFKYSLLLLPPWAIYSLFIFAVDNGFIGLLQKTFVEKALPGTKNAFLKTSYTGISSLDRALASAVVLFWPACYGSLPSVSLYGLCFAGGMAASWVLVFLETSRKGTSLQILRMATAFGVLMQTTGFALVMPIYFALSLSTLPRGVRWDTICVDLSVLKVLPASMIIGYITPILIMSLPAPSIIEFYFKQQILALWQVWPLLVSFLVSNLAAIHSKGRPNERFEEAHATIWYFRRVYAFGFACSAIPHLVACTLSLTAALFPTIFSADIAAELHPLRVFVPVLPWSGERPSSVAEGTLWFFHWDYSIGAVAVLLWAVALHTEGYRRQGIHISYIWLWFKILAGSAVAGVCGIAVGLIWERDELVFISVNFQGDSNKKQSEENFESKVR
ncbi:MAG: hypothetical protein M1834_007212 [Cirrosporium novae-zelandiae]|nr:MAG: hypothetical protein M1834_007212 [Cirrosporium novae-zelandiae]